MTTQNYSNLSV